MGLQIYTDNKKPRQLLKLIGDNSQQILECVEDLKTQGYEIIDFPPIEKNVAKQSWVNLLIEEPPASE
jgi:aryl carrier-like protein